MIQANEGDNYIKELVSAVNLSLEKNPKYKERVKELEGLLVYGVAKGKGIDLVIHESFKNSAELVNFIKSKVPNLRIHRSSYGEISHSPAHRIGLGYEIRLENQELCRKLILSSYLSLNNLLEF